MTQCLLGTRPSATTMLTSLWIWCQVKFNRQHGYHVTVRILHSEEEDNLFPLDSNISFACARAWKLTTTNILWLKQNGRAFADDIFKCILLLQNVWMSLKISLMFEPKVWINNIPALVQIMAWRWLGYKPLSEPMMTKLPMHICVTRPQWDKQTVLQIGFRICSAWEFFVTSCQFTISRQ